METEFKDHQKKCRPKDKPPRRLSGLKPSPFSKKHRIKFQVEDPQAEERLALIKKAARLRGRIFKGLHCALCKPCDWDLPTVPHHILNKGNYDNLRFEMMNLIPLCVHHHVPYAHGDQESFLLDLLDRYPRHYRFYLNEKDKRRPVKQTIESLTKIVADLQDCADNPEQARQVIYEKE